MEYRDFLKNKKKTIKTSSDIRFEPSKHLFDFQNKIVELALSTNRYAVFADCGLGKTRIQLHWANLITQQTNKNILIVTPLAVSSQTIQEGSDIGVSVNKCRKQDDVKPGLNITNYEMIEHFNPDKFVGVVLDESSILKNYTGKIKKQITGMFSDTKYKLCCTATPSPNDNMEILNHAAFLNVMESHQALAIWFINDTQNKGTYRLKKHAIDDFWQWVTTWAISLQKPADLGEEYHIDGFDLPQLNLVENIIEVDKSQAPDGDLFRMPVMSATSYHKESKLTAPDKVQFIANFVKKNTQDTFAIWCETNLQSDLLKKAIPEAVEIRGSHTPKQKEQAAVDFANGKIRILISKPSIFGFGMNFQVCHNVIFCGLSFSYESFYQATRRFYRFGQTKTVNVNIVIADTEKQILEVINRKQKNYKTLKESMYSAVINKQTIKEKQEYKMDYHNRIEEKKEYKMILGDSCDEILKIQDNSIDLQIFSPPFSSLYIYSNSYRDMGNNTDDEEFFKHFGFLIPELYRITKPGRLCVVHCKDLVDYKNRDGRSGLRDFPGRIITDMEKGGWKYHSRVTIWKNPVTEMERTKCQGLLHNQTCKDSSYSRQGLPDYLCVFRKWEDGENDNKIKGQSEKVKFTNWPGEEQPVQRKEKTKEDQEWRDSIRFWQKYASPVWFDINQMNVLNVKQARDDKDEKHICPLQLDVIERCINLWSNPNDIIFSPFAGIGSEGHVALKTHRRFLGIELKPGYFEHAIKNLKQAIIEREDDEMSLFKET